MSLRQADLKITAEEYLDGEPFSDTRHEFIDGVVYAMSGGTLNHNRIALNIFADLDRSLDGSSCKGYVNDVKVRVRTLESDTFYYPDLVVTCSKDDNENADKKTSIEHPTMIIEVLSDSTERTDRIEKFLSYRSLKSLEEYVLVSQKSKQVTIARKSNDWQAEVLEGDNFTLTLESLDVEISSARVFRNVTFSE